MVVVLDRPYPELEMTFLTYAYLQNASYAAGHS